METTRIDIATRKMVSRFMSMPPELEIGDLEIQESDPRYTAAKDIPAPKIVDFTDEYRSYYPELTARSQGVITESIKTSQPITFYDLAQNKGISNKQPKASRDQKDSGESVVPGQKKKATPAQKENPIVKAVPRNIGDTTEKNDEVGVSTSQQQGNMPPQNKNVVMPVTIHSPQQDTTPAQENGDETSASIIQNENTTAAETHFLPETPANTEPVAPETWNIDNVVGILSLQSKKRLCSAPESSPKRAKFDGHEILEKVNEQAGIIQQAMDKLQCNQDSKLQEVREAVEQNKQALEDMRSELRKFMSVVASTLRDIQERLEE
ncbi:uncharacterized protein Triagg1_7002 [Trichoderma aggressivum f. europaeum]|uniref:Uncharacterized protein n=1 Tax=Trichoderma aggressivum f. europaeum TaxID=173218 RepID=A0AAE1IEE8_9HYPO|nr:hypothetical protein Triagg1_7002 [Trichoderma aggressivum f. europaeum]